MMLSQVTMKSRRPFQSVKNKIRLLLVSDQPDNLNSLPAELGASDIEITSAKSVEDVRRACCAGHDVAVIDVGPAQLLKILKTLRASDGYKDISVLVDASRLSLEPSLAGVLPAYRAMPCSHAQLVALARRCASKVREVVRPHKSVL